MTDRFLNVVEYPGCYGSQWRCQNQQCIDGSYLCDGLANCYDESDELDCGESQTMNIQAIHFRSAEYAPAETKINNLTAA